VIRENVCHVVPLPGVVWVASSATRPTGMLRDVAETAAPRGCSANGGLSHGDASQTPPRLLVAAGVGGAVGHRPRREFEAGDGGLGGKEVSEPAVKTSARSGNPSPTYS
jgi:hypothetical protein